jgi:hypothetical protein
VTAINIDDPEVGRSTVKVTPVWYRAGDMERAVTFEPGYNNRGGPYGVHGMNIRWLLRGPAGVAQFLIFTHWVPGEIPEIGSNNITVPMGADVGYHALTPQYDGQESMGACEYLDGRDCFYDGSGLAAGALLVRLVAHGDAVVWRELQSRYEDIAAPGGAS